MISTKHVLGALVGLTVLGTVHAVPVLAQDSEAPKPFVCQPAPAPVVSLSIGSRYEESSVTRSEISEESNDDVNKALEPVEDYINDLSAMANSAYMNEPDAAAQADCVMNWLHVWAEGDALTELDSLNARLAVSPRLAGLALAFLQVQNIATPDPARDDVTRAWFKSQANGVIAFFQNEAGPLASTNNLRAWAGLATASIGQIVADQNIQQWARESYRLLVCGAEDSGALPAEMERGERALHYQLHALAPLAVTIGLIDPDQTADDELCSDKLQKIAEFTLEAVENPQIIADIVGKEQVFSGDDESELASYQLAWAEPYLARYPNEKLQAYIAPLRPLKYSKLGGNLTEIYRTPAADPVH